jgi:hypothetical protein
MVPPRGFELLTPVCISQLSFHVVYLASRISPGRNENQNFRTVGKDDIPYLMRRFSLLFITMTLSVLLMAQTTHFPTANEQIDASVLPLPEVMRAHATVLGYAPDMSLVTLRQGSNGMVCTASRPGSEEFDVRCYHQSFVPLLNRLRELDLNGIGGSETARIVDAEIKAKRLISWHSIHVPYKTAAELGLPEEGQVPSDMPYVMASGTFWCHVMIMHENNAAQK